MKKPPPHRGQQCFGSLLLTLQIIFTLTSCQHSAEVPTVCPTPDEMAVCGEFQGNDKPLAADPAEPEPAKAEEACLNPESKLVHELITDENSSGAVDLYIYLPPCYSENSAGDYPVLYLLHGQGFSNELWMDLGAAQIAEEIFLENPGYPFLMVFPLEENTNLQPESSDFSDQIVNAVIPWIDQNYQTCTLRRCRAVGGISRGAGWAVRLGLTRPDLFGAVGAHSLAPFSADRELYPAWIADIPADEMPDIYIDTGSEDRYRAHAFEFIKTLQENRVPYEWHIFPGEHEFDYWRTNLQKYLDWYASSFQLVERSSGSP